MAGAASLVLRLAAIAAGGLALRLIYTLNWAPDGPLFGDRFFFHTIAGLIADGDGYIDPYLHDRDGTEWPTAGHPPLYPLVLAAISKLGGGYEAHRLAGCFIGAATIFVIGVLASRVWDERAGVVAALLAAVYPVFVAADGALMSEPLYGLGIALSLLAAHSLLERPEPRRALLLGVALGLTALTRSEAVLLGLLLALVIWRALPEGGRRLALFTLLALALTVLPWSVRNVISLDGPVPISTNESTVIAGANCAETYSGRNLGLWKVECVAPITKENESEQAKQWRSDGLGYVRDHPGRLPLVVPARVARTWDLYQPLRQAELAEGRNDKWQKAGVVAFYAIALLALFGALRLRRRPAALALLLAPLVAVTVVSAIGFGTSRFRHGADVALVVLAAPVLAHAPHLRRP